MKPFVEAGLALPGRSEENVPMNYPWHRKRRQQQLEQELATHLQISTQNRIDQGAAPDEASYGARREFGNVALVQNVTRDQWSWIWIDNLLEDFRYAARTLRKNPAFSAVAILTLALGIGANTAIFSVVNAVIFRPLPFPQASRLLDICARSTLFDFTHLGVSLPDVNDIRTTSTTLAAVSPYQYSSKELVADGKPDHIDSADVTEDFFPLLGIKPLYGRTFTASDMQPGTHVVILGSRLWRERFGGDSSAIGKSILIDGQLQTIIGVMPEQPQLGFPTDFQLWDPFLPTQEDLTSRQNHDFSVLALLKPRVNLHRAQNELDAISARLAANYPDADKNWSLHAAPMKTYLLGDVSTPLLVLFGAVGFVLLIACANVSNLFLSRGWARRREFAIRSAIGATPGALLRQQLVESLLVALLGGVCAFLIALWTIHGLRALLPSDTPRLPSVRIESGVAYFALGASLLAALLSGLAPALLNSRRDVGAAIKENATGFGASASRHNYLRQLLVVGEIALAVTLVIAATLAIRSFARMLSLDPGFRPDHLITMRIDFPKFRFANVEQATNFVQQVLDSSRAIPGVEALSAGLVFPLGDSVAETTFETEESATEVRSSWQMVRNNRVAPDFFRTFGIQFIAGRDFDSSDSRGKPPVYIVNEAFARKVFGSLDVIGKRLSTDKESERAGWGEIVGLIRNVRELDTADEPKPEIYLPFSQTRIAQGVFIVVRTKPDPMVVVSAIQDRIWALDKNRPVTSIKTIERQLAESKATPRSQSTLLGIFGGLGFVLALVGVYGVMSYLVSQQTREIGIRMALGAAPRQVLGLVVSHGLKLTIAGVIIGLGTSLALTRFIGSLLFGISPTDPFTFAVVAISLTLVAIAACCIPARRAMRVDPMMALRHE
jgi:putative ABC transport system permease protein